MVEAQTSEMLPEGFEDMLRVKQSRGAAVPPWNLCDVIEARKNKGG